MVCVCLSMFVCLCASASSPRYKEMVVLTELWELATKVSQVWKFLEIFSQQSLASVNQYREPYKRENKANQFCLCLPVGNGLEKNFQTALEWFFSNTFQLNWVRWSQECWLIHQNNSNWFQNSSPLFFRSLSLSTNENYGSWILLLLSNVVVHIGRHQPRR